MPQETCTYIDGFFMHPTKMETEQHLQMKEEIIMICKKTFLKTSGWLIFKKQLKLFTYTEERVRQRTTILETVKIIGIDILRLFLSWYTIQHLLFYTVFYFQRRHIRKILACFIRRALFEVPLNVTKTDKKKNDVGSRIKTAFFSCDSLLLTKTISGFQGSM